MADRAGLLNRPTRYRAALAVVAAVVIATPLATGPARAQFFWDRAGRFSADDAARVAIDHGFRVLSRPVRNDDVYLVEVIDRRGARERLIITVESGEIVRRLFVEGGARYRRGEDRDARRAPDDDHHPGFFAKLFGGDDASDEDARPERPVRADRDTDLGDEPPRPRSHRYPRVVEQNRDTFRDTPIESAPLAPPVAPSVLAPRPPRPPRPPVQASLPPVPAPLPKSPPLAPVPVTPPASADRPVRSISSNPLAIPGSREQDEKTTGKAAQQTVPVKPPEAAPKPGPASVKPKEPVAVAPLD